MIPRINTTLQTPNWQNQMAQAINSPKALLQALHLPLELLPAAERAHTLFPLKVPLSYLKLINKRDPGDPLLRQVLPLDAEFAQHVAYKKDPVGDSLANPQQGLLHKYQGRVLLISTGACAIHCRYCFRRHFDYRENNPLGQQWQNTLDYIRADNSLFEAILSGGDPLSLSDAKLRQLISDLENIPHLKYLRIHTRLLVTIPQRLTEALLAMLEQTRFQVTLVTHINHAQEIGDDFSTMIRRLNTGAITLLNQSVLLKGVNDSSTSLQELSHKLFQNGIIPYYLHTLDKVEGANHFDIKESDVKIMYKALREALPGYLVPRLVREITGEPYKTPL